MLDKKLLERLVISKYMLAKARDTIYRSSPFTAGLAILELQDATEMLLRIIAEHLHAPVKEQSAFSQILDAISSVTTTPITHRSALNQLNKARVNFKHFGLEPRLDDSQKLLSDMESFFPGAVKSILGLEWDAVSLRSLVGHRRTENWLARAEEALQEGKYEDSADSSAVAFHIFLRFLGRDYNPLPSGFWKPIDKKSDAWKVIGPLIEPMQKTLQEQQIQLDIITDGVNISDYRRFLRLTPTVLMMMSNTFSIQRSLHHREAQIDYADASFCLRFVVDSILAMKKNGAHPRRPTTYVSDLRFKVIESCPVIVWPSKDPEVVRKAEKGEILFGRGGHAEEGYRAIVEDDDEFYVPESAVQEVESQLRTGDEVGIE